VCTACGIMHRRSCLWLKPVPPEPCHQQATSSVHNTTSCKHSLAFLRMDEIIARNMFELIEITNKLLLLHLVGCLYILLNNLKFTSAQQASEIYR